jgi:hypothetical protein
MLSIKIRERERRAVADFKCPLTLCNADPGTPCYTPSSSTPRGRVPARPKARPHKSRVDLVPDWTEGAATFESTRARYSQEK